MNYMQVHIKGPCMCTISMCDSLMCRGQLLNNAQFALVTIRRFIRGIIYALSMGPVYVDFPVPEPKKSWLIITP